MLNILIILGLLAVVDFLMGKFFIWDRIEKYGPNAPNRFIYNLIQCKFCMLFHISWMLTLVYGLFVGFSWELLSVPFIVSGLYNLRFNGL